MSLYLDPYMLEGCNPMANVPLSTILFPDEPKHPTRPFSLGTSSYAAPQQISSSRVSHIELGRRSALTNPAKEEGPSSSASEWLLPSAVTILQSALGDPPRLNEEEEEESPGGIDNDANRNNLFSRDRVHHRQQEEEEEGRPPFLRSEVADDSSHTDNRELFHLRVKEAERRMAEQLDIHRELNAALMHLTTVSKEVTLARTQQAVVEALGARSAAAVHGSPPIVPVPVVFPSAKAKAASTTVPSATQTAFVSTAPKPLPLSVAAINAKGTPLTVPTSKTAAPAKAKIAVVPAPEDPVPYRRVVLRRKQAPPPPTTQPTGKAVSIALDAPLVTHFDTDSPAVSMSRPNMIPSIVRRSSDAFATQDSVRVSMSNDSSIPEMFASGRQSSSQLDRSDSTLSRRESSSSIRVSYVDRNMASVRRSSTASIISEDLASMYSSEGSSESDMAVEALAASRGSFSYNNQQGRRSSSAFSGSYVESFRGDSYGSARQGGSVKPRELFQIFHALCQRIADVVVPEEDNFLGSSSPILERLRASDNVASVRSDIHDVHQLRHFIQSMAQDVRTLEKQRKAKQKKQALLLKAQKMARARKAMMERNAALHEIEEEFGVTFAGTATGGEGVDNEMEMEFDDDFYRQDDSGSDNDEIKEEFHFDDVDDNEWDMEDEIQEVGFEGGDMDEGDAINDENLHRLQLDEEDVADYFVQHTEQEVLQSPPSKLGLIRYGGTREQKGGESVPRAVADEEFKHARGSRSPSVYSWIEEDEDDNAAIRKAASFRPTRAADYDDDVADMVERRSATRSMSGGSDATTARTHRSATARHPHQRSYSRESSIAEVIHENQESGSGAVAARAGAGLSRKPSRYTGGGGEQRPFERGESNVRAVFRRTPSPDVDDVVDSSSYWEKSESSGDGDLESVTPNSTPYTSSSSSYAGSTSETNEETLWREPSTNPTAAMFPFATKWALSARRRKQAMVNIAPLRTWSDLYEPKLSPLKRPPASAIVPLAAPPGKLAGKQPERLVQDELQSQYDTDVAISPLSCAPTPMAPGGAARLVVLQSTVPPSLHGAGDRYGLVDDAEDQPEKRQGAGVNQSGDDEDGGKLSSASPPHVSESAPLQGFSTMNAPGAAMEQDTVLMDDREHVPHSGADTIPARHRTVAMGDAARYDEDDFVALAEWKNRQKTMLRELLPAPPARAGEEPSGVTEEEFQVASEANRHWAALETLLHHRFAHYVSSSSDSRTSDDGSSDWTSSSSTEEGDYRDDDSEDHSSEDDDDESRSSAELNLATPLGNRRSRELGEPEDSTGKEPDQEQKE